MTPDISGQGPKLLDATRRAKLVSMLRSTLRSWPRARLQHSTSGDFGVSLDGATFVRVCTNGGLTDEDLRDVLALFVVWLAVEPDRLRQRIAQDGLSVQVERLKGQ